MTGIQWTDETWNPICGCSKVSQGCRGCYAEKMAARLRAMALADIEAGRDPGRKRYYIEAVDERGRWTGKVVPVPEALPDPLHWTRPRRVFVNSMSDLFHPELSFQYIAAVFGVMWAAHEHTFQVLTKHPDRAAEFFAWLGCAIGRNVNDGAAVKMATDPLTSCQIQAGRHVRLGPYTVGTGQPSRGAWPLPNVWLGTSVESPSEQHRVDELRRCPAAVRFVSQEPQIEAIDWAGRLDGISWVIVGGESGCGARPFNVAWARRTIEQCRAAGVAVFLKQLGRVPLVRLLETPGLSAPGAPGGWQWPVPLDTAPSSLSGILAAWTPRLRHPKGGNWDEWPEELRVREYPAPVAA